MLYIYTHMYKCYEMEQTFNIVFIGDLSDLFQQLHPEPVKLKKVNKNHHPYSTLTTSMNLVNETIN